MESKLEAIKHAWEDHKKHGDITTFALHYSKQLDWLIEQAEKVEKLEKQNEQLKENFKSEATCQEYWKDEAEQLKRRFTLLLDL